MIVHYHPVLHQEINVKDERKAIYLTEIGYEGRKRMNFTKYEMELYKEWVMTVEYKRVGRKTTIALVTTEEGFEIVGTSACVNPNDYDQEIGEHYALKDALKKLDELTGFYRQMTEPTFAEYEITE